MTDFSSEHDGYSEKIHSRYLLACDGSHSWTAEELTVPTDAESQHSVWGVVDIKPETDFRKSNPRRTILPLLMFWRSRYSQILSYKI